MLLPEQVVPFLQHDDPIVREHALAYFRDTYDFGPLTAEHYWAVIDRLGENRHTLRFAAQLNHLPQTDASLKRVVQTLASEISEDFEFHYLRVARDMQLDVLARNRAELLACPQLTQDIREHLEFRLSLMDQPPAAAWDRLMEHGRMLGPEYSGHFNRDLSDALIEAAAQGGNSICEQAMIILGDESAADDWREIFAVRVLGMARYAPGIDALVQKFAIDTDVLREETNRALTRISSPEVIERIVDFYPGKPWHVRLYANDPLANIKLPQSEEGLLKLLGVELALEADPDLDDEGHPHVDSVLIELTELGSLAGIDESRRLIEKFPQDPEVMYLCRGLLATAIMNGMTLPEETVWRKLLEAQDKRSAARARYFDSLFRGVAKQRRKTNASLPDAEGNLNGSQLIDSNQSVEIVKPIRNAAPKVGRNDPCPCGSGKKYKKCCANTAPSA